MNLQRFVANQSRGLFASDVSAFLPEGCFFLPLKDNGRLTRVEATHVTRERDDLSSVAEPARCVINDDYVRPSFLDLASNGKVEVDPPRLMPFQGRRP